MPQSETDKPKQLSEMRFDEKTFSLCFALTKALYAQVPELAGIAFIPIWDEEDASRRFGLVSGRNGPIQDTATLARLIKQLVATTASQVDSLHTHLHKCDQLAQQMAEQLDAKQQQLIALDQQIAGRREELQQTATPRGAAAD